MRLNRDVLGIALLAVFALPCLLPRPAIAQATSRVSVDSAGTEANGASVRASLSGDGRFVAFESSATNLVAGDTNGVTDVFVRDLVTGATERISVDSAGTQANGVSTLNSIQIPTPSLSGDGRFVVFQSTATNLVAGDTNGGTDVFLRDRQAGTTTRVSVDSAGAQANGASARASISFDGRLVAFDSTAANLVAGDTNGLPDLFVRDVVAGVTTRENLTSAGAEATGGFSRCPSLSADGGILAFESAANNLVAGDTNGVADIFVRDRVAGTTTRASVDSAGGQANSSCLRPSISSDGNFVVFDSTATNLVPGDTNGIRDVFVRDLQAATTTRASVDSLGAQASGGANFNASLSGDGNFVVFESTSTNLVPGDTNGRSDIFLRDRLAATTTRVSVDAAGNEANGLGSFEASVSGDGSLVSFDSTATNLVAGDTNAVSDVFLVLVDVTAPTVPVLATPLDGAISATSTVALDWTDSTDAASGVASYDVEVASDAAFTLVEWSATVVPSNATTGALPDRPHFWHVRARDNVGNLSSFSASRMFTIDTTAATVPVLATPSDGALLATSTVALDWLDSTDATSGVASYDVEVASDAAFTLVEWSATVGTSVATTGVLPDGLHFWRVRARDNAGNLSAFSAARTFSTDTVPPSVPVLASPGDLAILGLPAVPLDWLDSTDATSGVASYDVQVAVDAAFTGIAWSATVGPSAATTAALADEVYFWRVRARDGAGNLSAFSAARRFTVLASVARWQPSAPGADAGGGVSNTAAPSTDPCLAVNPVSGQPGVAWTDLDPVGGDAETYMRERLAASFAERAGSASGGGVSNNATASQSPSIAYDASGRPVVAWQDATDGDPDIYVRRFDGAAWTELAGSATGSGVSANTTSSTDPCVAVNPMTGQPGVAWADFQLGDFEILFREFNGTAWTDRAGSGAGQGISANGGASLEPSLAYDATGRAVVAWVDQSSGNFEVYLRRWTGALWEELGGSASAGGVSMTATDSRHPSVAIDSTGQPTVIWEERLAGGNSEIYGRRWTGTAWAEAGAGADSSGGISRTPGTSSEPHLSVNAAGTLLLAVWTDGSDAQGDMEVYGKVLSNGVWREIGGRSARLGGISDNASTSTHACGGVGTSYAYVSWQDNASGNWEVYVRRLLLANFSDGPMEIVVGPGRGGNGQYRVFDDGTTGYAARELRTLTWGAYDAANGALHPACGDVDGDGLSEVVLGLGTYTPSGGWAAVMRDHSGRFDLLRWVRLPWSAYNAANGEVFPACGDLDGDGRAEIVLGTGRYPAGGGMMAIFDDATRNHAFLQWVRGGFGGYNSANGTIHPACGDVDGDGLDELVLGLGQGGKGVVSVRDDLRHGFTTIASILYPNSAYDQARGDVWPSCVDASGNGWDDVVLGPGRGGEGRLYVFADRSGGFSRTGALSVPWGVYASSIGEARPAGGNLDADASAEVVVGLGAFPGAGGGFLYVFDDVTAGGSVGGRWIRYVNGSYNSTNGETWPAVGQVR